MEPRGVRKRVLVKSLHTAQKLVGQTTQNVTLNPTNFYAQNAVKSANASQINLQNQVAQHFSHARKPCGNGYKNEDSVFHHHIDRIKREKFFSELDSDDDLDSPIDFPGKDECREQKFPDETVGIVRLREALSYTESVLLERNITYETIPQFKVAIYKLKHSSKWLFDHNPFFFSGSKPFNFNKHFPKDVSSVNRNQTAVLLFQTEKQRLRESVLELIAVLRVIIKSLAKAESIEFSKITAKSYTQQSLGLLNDISVYGQPPPVD